MNIIIIIYIFSIDRAEFVRISNIIVTQFPTEIHATYFVPSHSSSQASGKLYSAYKKYRLRLQEVGLATKRQPRYSKVIGKFNNYYEITLIEIMVAFYWYKEMV